MLMRHLLPCHRSYATVLILTARKSTGKVNLDILVFTCRIDKCRSVSTDLLPLKTTGLHLSDNGSEHPIFSPPPLHP